MRLALFAREIPRSASLSATGGGEAQPRDGLQLRGIAARSPASGTEIGLALAEIGQGGKIRLSHLRRHHQDTEGIGCETEIHLGIAELPAGYTLDLKVALRSSHQLDTRRLRGGEANRLYGKAVGPRREIAEEVGACRDFTD